MRHWLLSVLPWWFRGCIILRRGEARPFLYTFDGRVSTDDAFVGTVRRQRIAMGQASRKGSIARITN
jgi:hypothetical protein